MTDEILQHMITLALWGYSLRGELINDSNKKKRTCKWRSERYKPSQPKQVRDLALVHVLMVYTSGITLQMHDFGNGSPAVDSDDEHHGHEYFHCTSL